jgi:hypothetical protein
MSGTTTVRLLKPYLPLLGTVASSDLEEIALSRYPESAVRVHFVRVGFTGAESMWIRFEHLEVIADVELLDPRSVNYNPERLRVEALLALEPAEHIAPSEKLAALADWIVDRAEEAYLDGQASIDTTELVRLAAERAAGTAELLERERILRLVDEACFDQLKEPGDVVLHDAEPEPAQSWFEAEFPHFARHLSAPERHQLSRALGLDDQARPTQDRS